MNRDSFLTSALAGDWRALVPAGVVALLVLLLAAWLLRRKGRDKLARRVTAAATLLGLGWSAQGMWDTAVHHYHQDVVVASVLFVIFEAMLTARMLKAHQYRTDFARRPRHVRSVWVIAGVMALVVALGEGWTQAPARLAIPLLVAYGWYVDLTADDDPATRPRTSLRWTPRRLALLVGMIEPGERDAETIDRDRLRNRLTRLAFRKHHGAPMANDLLRRPTRLQRLLTVADDADVTEVRARLARSRVDLMVEPVKPVNPPERETHPVAPPQPNPPERVQPAKPADPQRLPQGVHMRDGIVLRGPELAADAILLMRKSVAQGRPLTIEQLRDQYTPRLGERKGQEFSAAGRRPLNGNAPEGVGITI
jgi:hypothetical protein